MEKETVETFPFTRSSFPARSVNVVIVHGWDAAPDSNWFPWLKQVLMEDGITCEVPTLPNSALPVLSDWVQQLNQTIENLKREGKLILVGHSLGCITIAHYLNQVEKAYADGCIFVAGFSGNVRNQAFKEFYETAVNFENAKKKIGRSISLFSRDDLHVPFQRSHELANQIGSEIVDLNGYQHFMGSQGVRQLPVLLPELQKLL